MNKKAIVILTISVLIISGCTKKEPTITIEQPQEQEAIEKVLEETVETVDDSNQSSDDDQSSEDNQSSNDTEVSVTLEEDELENKMFDIPKDKEKVETDEFVIFNSYNAFSITWVGDSNHKHYKLYASSKPEGNYGFIKDVVREEGETDPYSVTLENFELNSNVYIKVTSIQEENDADIETVYGDIIHYSSKTASELNNAELNHHLILKFPLIASDDQQMMFRFYDRYLIDESDEMITVTSNLKGDHIELFDQSMSSEYKDEIIQLISDIYTYVYEIREKKVVGIVEDKLEITVNASDDITVELK